MISDDRQDLALAYLLGEMDPRQASRFEGDLAADVGLRQFVEEMRESAAALTQALPSQPPPPGLRARILAGVKTAASESSARSATPPVPWRWLTPALGGLAACLALALGGSMIQNRLLSKHVSDADVEASLLSKKLTDLSRQISTYQSTTAAQRRQIVELQNRSSLAEVKIATLAAQAEAYQRAGVVVVWDERTKQGLIKLVNLPKAAAGKDYQLWIIDSKASGGPVSAGVLAISDGTATLDSFKSAGTATPSGGFAISVEKTGGSTTPEGTIVFVGN